MVVGTAAMLAPVMCQLVRDLEAVKTTIMTNGDSVDDPIAASAATALESYDKNVKVWRSSLRDKATQES